MFSKKMVALTFIAMVSFMAHAQPIDFQNKTGIKISPAFESKDEALNAAGLAQYNTEENRVVFDANAERIEKAKNIVGEAYAGSWIEYDARNRARHVIAVAGKVNAEKLKLLSAGDSEFVVVVKYSYAFLESNQRRIFDYFRKLAGNHEPLVYSVGIDDRINRILVRGRASNLSYIESRLRGAGFDMNMLKLEVQEGQLTLSGVVN